MELAQPTQYLKYRITQNSLSKKDQLMQQLIYPMLLFGGIGAITWAIRGTAGWGGFDGAIIHGMIWGILWYYISYLRGIDARFESFWLGIGVSIGGMWGYGQYVSWIQSEFLLDNSSGTWEMISISPLYGYLWFFICGVAWLGIGGIFLGWALGDIHSSFNLKKWIIRILVPLGFALLGILLTKILPQAFFPLYTEELYSENVCNQCERTISTNTTNTAAIMWWVGALVVAKIEKDSTTIKVGSILGIGFGFGFAIAGIWCLGYKFNSAFIDWWKVWEMTDGLFAGFLYALALYLVQKDFDQAFDSKYKGDFTNESNLKSLEKVLEVEILNTDNILNNSESLQSLKKKRPPQKLELYKNWAIIFTAFLLLLVAWYGGTFKLGVFLDLYDEATIGQYGFNSDRWWLLIPVALIFIIVTLRKMVAHYQQAQASSYRSFEVRNIHEKILHLLLFLSFLGIMTIWDAVSPKNTKIGVIYSLYTWMAVMGMWKVQKSFINPPE